MSALEKTPALDQQPAEVAGIFLESLTYTFDNVAAAVAKVIKLQNQHGVLEQKIRRIPSKDDAGHIDIFLPASD